MLYNFPLISLTINESQIVYSFYIIASYDLRNQMLSLCLGQLDIYIYHLLYYLKLVAIYLLIEVEVIV